MKSVNFFRNVVCNCFLVVCVVVVFVFGISSPVQSVFGTEKLSPVYVGNTNSNKVCLMVNVYWGTEFVEPMLECFKQFGVKTTFFVGGSWVSEHVSVLNKIVADGHEIGNHGYYHKEHEKLSESRNKEEIEICHQVVLETSKIEMNLFAPPGGSFSQTTLKVAQNLGYKTIMWTKDTIDWRDKDERVVFERATDVEGGSLVLMHPTKHTLKALPQILQNYVSRGLVATTVSNCLV